MKDFVHKRKKLYGFEKEEIFFIVQTFLDVTSFIAAAAEVRYKLKRERERRNLVVKKDLRKAKENISKQEKNTFSCAKPKQDQFATDFRTAGQGMPVFFFGF